MPYLCRSIQLLQPQHAPTWQGSTLLPQTPGATTSTQEKPEIEKVQFIGGNLANHVDKWKELTHDKFVLEAITGYKLEFNDDREPSHYLCESLSCDINVGERSDLRLEVDKLLRLDIIEPSRVDNSQVVSPIFTVAKSDGSKRMILNLKRLNEHIKYRHFKMESSERVKEIVDHNWFLGSIDLEKAYHSIPIHSDSRKYLKFRFEGQLYQYKTLPMGLSSAPYVFTRIMKVLFTKLRTLGLHSVFYLDDSLLAGSTYKACKENIQKTAGLLQSAGFSVSMEKSSLIPSRTLEFLGFIYNTVDMTCTLPERKVCKLSEQCTKLLHDKSPTLRSIAKVVGTIISIIPVCKIGKLHYRELERCKIEGLRMAHGKYNSKTTLSQKAHEELQWWINVPSKLMTTCIAQNISIDLEVFSDACMTGYGFWFNTSKLAGHWSPEDLKVANRHINGLELLAVLKGVEHFKEELRNKNILLRCDNSTAVYYVNNMGGQSSLACNEIAKSIWSLCIDIDIWITASFIAGKQNIQADKLSRLKPNTELSLSDKAFKIIQERFGTPDIDMFASDVNKKCSRYVSWKQDQGAWRVNAFTINWSQFRLIYAFPPFSLMGRVLQKATKECCKNILIVYPIWKSQPWYPKLQQLIKEPLELEAINTKTTTIPIACGLI